MNNANAVQLQTRTNENIKKIFYRINCVTIKLKNKETKTRSYFTVNNLNIQLYSFDNHFQWCVL